MSSSRAPTVSTIKQPNADFGVWVQNTLGVLTEGGQFFHDSAAGKVYYKPLAGESIATADVHLGVLETVVAVAGTYASPAQNIKFDGVSFVSSWTESKESSTNHATGSYHMAEAKYPWLC